MRYGAYLVCQGWEGESRWIECLVFSSMQTRGFKCLVVGLLAMNVVREEWICLILMHVKVRLKGDDNEGTGKLR